MKPTLRPLDVARRSVVDAMAFSPRGPETQIYSIEGSDLDLVAVVDPVAERCDRLGELRAADERARTLEEIYRAQILPQAEAAVESAFAAYQVGSVDYATLLDARLILGDEKLFAEFLHRFRREVLDVDARAFIDTFFDQALDLVVLGLADDRPDVGFGIVGVAGPGAFRHPRRHGRGLVVTGFVDQHPAGGVAGLAGVLEAAARAADHGLLEIRVIEDDVGGLATQLQKDLGHVLCR